MHLLRHLTLNLLRLCLSLLTQSLSLLGLTLSLLGLSIVRHSQTTAHQRGHSL